MALHRTLTGSQLHEPKGIDDASIDQVYKADGAGSGSWSTLTSETYTHMYTNVSGTDITDAFATTGDFYILNNATLFGTNTLTWFSSASNGIVNDLTEGYAQVPAAGDYYVEVSMALFGSAPATTEYEVSIGVASASDYSTVADYEDIMHSFRTVTTTNKGSLSFSGIIPLLSGDRVYILMRNNTNTNAIGVKHTNFVVQRVA